MTLPSRHLRYLLSLYLVAVAVVTAGYAALSARAMHPWIDGEWLINYSAGMVRRGLTGEGLLLVSRGLHLPLIVSLLLLQLAVYAAIYVGLYRLTKGVRWSMLLIAAIVSPATLAFTVLDPPSSVRKEGLLFAVLASVLLVLLSGRSRMRAASDLGTVVPGALLLAVAAPALVLTHEALLCYLPYLFAGPFLLLANWKTALRMVAGPVALALLVTGVVVAHPGNRAQAVRICDSISDSVGVRSSVDRPESLCGGAIAYLGKDREAAHRETMRAASVYRYPRRYPLPMLLSLAPAALLLGRRLRRGAAEERRTTWTLLAFAVGSLMASLPLFFIARDWGRWTHLHAMCLLLLLLAVERPRTGLPVPTEGGLKLSPSRPRRLLGGLALLLYAGAWTLPAVGIFPGRFGYFDLYRYVRGYRTAAHASPVHAGFGGE